MMKDKFVNTFREYASAYDLTDPKILLKYIHTEKVADNCGRIACSLNLPREDAELAWQIGMLHDIGRFEQLRRFDTFNDAASIDHAQFGADLLFGGAASGEFSMEDPLVAHYDIERKDYALIELAIRSHNRYRIPEGLSERETMFCHIIRDADKVDIWRANYETGMAAIYNVTEQQLRLSGITAEVFDAFMERHAVLHSLKKTPLDRLVGHLSLYWELVYPMSREMAWEQGYLQKLLEFETENAQAAGLLEQIRIVLQKDRIF